MLPQVFLIAESDCRNSDLLPICVYSVKPLDYRCGGQLYTTVLQVC